MMKILKITIIVLLSLTSTFKCDQDYFYTRTRIHPNHLRVSEDFKNNYLDEIKFESVINGTKWEYFKSNQVATFDELVFETIDKIFRHRLSAFYIHHYDKEEDKKTSSDKRRVSQEKCARDLLYLLDKLHTTAASKDNHLTPELSAFFDSYARPEAGILRGNTYWVGEHDQCVTRHIFDLLDKSGLKFSAKHQHLTSPSSSGQNGNQEPRDNDTRDVVSFKGRYCVASIKSPKWDELIERRKLKSKDYFRTNQQIQDYSKLFRLQLGLCLPDSCDSSSLERHHGELKLLTKHALASGSGLVGKQFSDYELIDLYCLPDEASPLRQWSSSAYGFIILVGTWISLVLLATLADICEFTAPQEENIKQSKMSLFVGWLSLRANYRKIMHVTEDEHSSEKPKQPSTTTTEDSSMTVEGETNSKISQPRQSEPIVINLRFLNAFKVMVMFWIVNGHIMLLMVQTAKNILDSDALLNGLMHFLIGATFGVDLFFTMTGFLTSYLLFNSGQALKMKLGHWLYLSFHRYWRLAPMYLLAFWFSRSVMQSLGSGPLWDYGTSSITYRGLCKEESWWYPLTLTSNLHGLFEECMITSWYISCDMQFWLISPVFLHLLAHHPVSGWLATLATIAASCRVRYNSLLSEKAVRYDELVQPRADIFMRVSHDMPALYTHPHYRVSAYLVGLLAGHYVYMIKSGAWTSSIIPKRTILAENNTTVSANIRTTEKVSPNNVFDNQQTMQKTQEEKESINTSRLGSRSRSINLPTNIRRSILAYFGLGLFLLMAFVSYLTANFFPPKLLAYSRQISSYAYALDHLFMSVGASLVIVTMCFGQWPRLIRWLSHPNWTRLSKLNYALLLIQCELIYYEIFRYEQVPLAGTRELINILFNLLVSLYPIAFVVTLFFEFPLANLEKLLLGGGRKKKL